MKEIITYSSIAILSVIFLNCSISKFPAKSENEFSYKSIKNDITHISLGMIDYEILDSSKIDSSQAETTFQMMKLFSYQDIIFNTDISVSSNTMQNIGGQTFKTFYDKRSKECTMINLLGDSIFYTIIDYDKLLNEVPFSSDDSILISKMFKFDVTDIKYIYGFKCKKLFIMDLNDVSGNKVQSEMYLTDEIPCFPLIKIGNNKYIQGFPLEFITYIDGIKIYYGPTFYEKNNELKKSLKINLENYYKLDYITFSERLGSASLQNDKMEGLEDEVPIFDFKYGKAVNLDIYKKMQEDQELKKFDMLTLYEDALPSLDKGSLVQILSGYVEEDDIFDRNEILRICKNYQLIDEELEKKIIEIDQKHIDTSITSYDFIRLISLVTTLDLLNQQVVRDSFAKSLLYNGYRLKNEADNSIVSDYVSGKIDLADFLGRFQGIFSLQYTQPVNSGEKYLQTIVNLLKQLFDKSFTYQYLNFENDTLIGNVIVKKDSLQMTYPIHKDPCFYENKILTTKLVNTKICNPSDFEAYVEGDLKHLILQLNADFDLKMNIGLPFRYLLFWEIHDSYKVPETDPLNGKIIVIMVENNSTKSLPPDIIPFESQMDPENRDFVSTFKSVFSQVELNSYIGFQDKQKFSKFLYSHRGDVVVKEFDCNKWLNEVRDEIITDMAELLASVPNLVYVRKYDNSIIKNNINKDFKQLFPEINRYMGDKFKAENFQVHLISLDEEIVKISFVSYDKEYSFSCSAYESDFEMLKIADEILKSKNINNDVHLYNIYGNEYIKYMIYLSDELKNELETEFELHFEPVD